MRPKTVPIAFAFAVALVASTAVSILAVGRGAALDPSLSDRSGDFRVVGGGSVVSPGAVATHTVVVSATESLTSVVTLRVGPHVWPVEVPDAVVVPPRARASVIVTVTIPVATGDRAYDAVEVGVAAEQPGRAVSVTLVTRTGGEFDGSRYVGCRLDFDLDGVVDADDAGVVAGHLGADTTSRPDALPYDLDGSGLVDATDYVHVAARVGRACRIPATVDSTVLRTAITTAGLRVHIEALQAIATANRGNRAFGSSGYEASACYVEATLAAAGLASRRETVQVPYFRLAGPPVVEELEPRPTVYDRNTVRVLQYSGLGEVAGFVQAVDVLVPPGGAPDASTSGCEASDFTGFARGRIALVQRGTCAYARKVALAEAAGAAAVIVFNEGQASRRDVSDESLGLPGARIPAFLANYAFGEDLVARGRAGEVVRLLLRVDAESGFDETWSVLADLPGTADDDVVVLGAHLDSVPAGPGINDNGSGVAAVLEVARRTSALVARPPHGIRFAFWAAEELGIVGSAAHVASLAPPARRKVLVYLNLDMIASPNWGRFVHEGDETAGANRRAAGAAEVETAFVRYFEARGEATLSVDLDGRTDHSPFDAAGIASGGLHTGTSLHKTAAQAALFGGSVGQPYDPCYHSACDTIDNVDWPILEEMADAAAHVTWQYAWDRSMAYHHAADGATDDPAAPSRTCFLPSVRTGNGAPR